MNTRTNLMICVMLSVTAVGANEAGVPESVVGVPLRGEEAVAFL